MINDKYFLSMLQRAPLHTQSSLAALAASPPGPPSLAGPQKTYIHDAK